MKNKIIYHQEDRSMNGYKLRAMIKELFTEDASLSHLKSMFTNEMKKVKINNRKTMADCYRIDVQHEFTINAMLMLWKLNPNRDILIIQIYQT
jgi:cAMP phosphodiesterase